MQTIYLHTGSNMGDPAHQLKEAIQHIEEQIGTVTQQSSVYETEPWGLPNQPNFFNQALEVKTTLVPEIVLQKIHQIEASMGRTRTEKWAARNIDIDLIFYANQKIQTEELTVPHPHLQDRNFVLIPLLEIAPEFMHPELGETIEELYFRCNDTLEVIMLEKE